MRGGGDFKEMDSAIHSVPSDIRTFLASKMPPHHKPATVPLFLVREV